MIKQRRIYTAIFIIIVLITFTCIYSAAAPEDCDDGTGASMQPGEQNALDCGAETPVVNTAGDCVSSTRPYEVNNGCTPFTLYQKTGDEDWADMGAVSRSFNYACDVTNDCDDPVEIKVVDSQTQASCTFSISSSGNYNPIVWDTDHEATIPKNGSLNVSITGGNAPYTWTVSEGFSFGCESGCGTTNTLYSEYNEDQACMATINVTDNCGEQVTGYVRHPGSWAFIDNTCSLPGPATEAISYIGDTLVRIEGDKKQTQHYSRIWTCASGAGGGCTGENICAEQSAQSSTGEECITFDCLLIFRSFNTAGEFAWCEWTADQYGAYCSVFNASTPSYYEWECD